ncbi:MAG: hypothetical protein AABX71_02325, partial [Nanoarchaeota archaeon]
ERILKIWLMNRKQEQKKSIAEKYASHCHISVKRAMKDFPIFRIILQNEKIQKHLNLNEKEVEFLKN